MHEERLQKNPKLVFRAFLVANRVENMTDEQVFGQAKQLGACEVETAPMMPQLVDVYGVGVRKKLEFGRTKEDTGEYAVVARGSVGIKLVGDYINDRWIGCCSRESASIGQCHPHDHGGEYRDDRHGNHRGAGTPGPA